jgi:hypothetical protein
LLLVSRNDDDDVAGAADLNSSKKSLEAREHVERDEGLLKEAGVEEHFVAVDPGTADGHARELS